VVLNKADQLDPAELERVAADIRARVRPEVKLLRAAHGQIGPEVLLGLVAGAEGDLDARPSRHDGLDDHDHDDFTTFALEIGELAHPDELLARLMPAVAEHDILRVKGFAAVAGRDMRLVVQGVGGRLQHYFDRDWRPDEPRAGRLVVIARSGLDEQAVARKIAG
jgi:cobalamin biosynthesis protein CobW